MGDAERGGIEAARAFLDAVQADEALSRQVDQAVDDQILSVARVVAVERGFKFSSAELRQAVIERLSLNEALLNDPDGGAGKCKTDSGCRTPCVYCKSNKFPTLGDIGEEVIINRGGSE